jgi:hypothetical protein
MDSNSISSYLSKESTRCSIAIYVKDWQQYPSIKWWNKMAQAFNEHQAIVKNKQPLAPRTLTVLMES